MADVFHTGQHDDLTAHGIYKIICYYYGLQKQQLTTAISMLTQICQFLQVPNKLN